LLIKRKLKKRMIFKIKEFSLFIFLFLLQSCSMGRIGNFLESSFDGLGSEDSLEKSVSLIEEKQENDKTNSKEIKNEEKSKINVGKKKVISLKKQENNKTNSKEIKNEEKSKINVGEKKVVSLKKQKNFTKEIKTKKVYTSQKKIKNGLQSYKIIFILKDVDPKDPIEKLSSILSDSEVNFEIEKIERFFDSENKNAQSN